MSSGSHQPPTLLDDAYVYEGGHLLHNLLLFGRLCKGLGLDVNPERMLVAAQALQFIGLAHRTDVYHALRSTIVTHRRDLPLFDEAFHEFWRVPPEGGPSFAVQSMGEQRYKPRSRFLPPAGSSPDEGDDTGKPALDQTMLVIVPTYSNQAALRHKDFAQMTGEELDAAKASIAQLQRTLGLRRTRRYQPGRGAVLDVRRSFRRNMRYAGEPIEQPTRKRVMKPRPLVLICDISGSMERYARILLHFAHTLANSIYQVESFVYSTSLTQITHPIRHKSVDLALREVGHKVNDWGGGTKTGEALREFNYRWSRRVLSRGAIVMLITDGWDRGDPDLLKKEMARLQRSCHRLIWLNPLLAAPQYEPLTRGAQAILPYVDDFLPVQNLANLETIVRELARVDWQRGKIRSLSMSPFPSPARR
ncbi:MAG: VWA domain-containing protein [Anaerolineae bacterium]